jgi:sugar phosphate permease
MKKPRSTTIVLGLLCVMYLITYIDRVNIATAASEIRRDLGLSNTRLGLALSAFGYPYLLFQIFGGWIGDRVGPRLTLFVCGVIWAAATILTGLAGSLLTLFLIRVLLGIGEGATFPVATRAMQTWTPPGRRGFAQGITHAFARFGNMITPPIVAWLIALLTWRGSFVTLGCVSLIWVIVWFSYYRDNPAEHQGITEAELDALPNRGVLRRKEIPNVPWRQIVARLMPVTIVYFCYGWTLWLYLNWLPSFFFNAYHMDIMKSAIYSSTVFSAGVIGDMMGGIVSDGLLRRTANVRSARLVVVIGGFLGSFLTLLPIVLTHNLGISVVCLSVAFFFAELVIGPMWAIPMDIAPKYSGTAAGIMNSGSALAAILSPLAFGYVADVTGDWHLPFIGSLALLLLGAALAFTMHPERQLHTSDVEVPTSALS